MYVVVSGAPLLLGALWLPSGNISDICVSPTTQFTNTYKWSSVPKYDVYCMSVTNSINMSLTQILSQNILYLFITHLNIETVPAFRPSLFKTKKSVLLLLSKLGTHWQLFTVDNTLTIHIIRF